MKKNEWSTPTLEHYGSVEEVTAGFQQDKNPDGADGITLQGNSIGS